MSLFMLDASRANEIWPLHSSNASCWSSASQLNLGAEILAVRLPLCCNETKIKGLEMNQILCFALVNRWNEYRCSYEGLERKFVWVISLSDIQRIRLTQYLAQYNGLERKLSKGLEMSQKWTLLEITFELLGVGGCNFAGWCASGVGTFWLNFKSLLLILLELLLFLCF